MITRAGHRMLPSLASASVGRDMPIFRVAAIVLVCADAPAAR